MSVIKVNNITNRDGTTGPVIAGITTVSSTSHLVVPTGSTGQRVALAPDPFINNLVLALPFNSESVFDDISPRGVGLGPIGLGTTTASFPFGVSGVTTTSSGITTFSKYYGNSCYFNGNTQYFTTAGVPDLVGNFTIETWIYMFNLTPVVGNINPRIVSTSGGFNLVVQTDGFLRLDIGSLSQSSSTSLISTGNWYHIAHVRTSGTHRVYLNGQLTITLIDSTTLSGNNFVIGREYAQSSWFYGYMQDLRVYNGVAKYTGISTTSANFTPPNQIAL